MSKNAVETSSPLSVALAALSQAPTRRNWLETLAVFLLFAPTASLMAITSGLVQPAFAIAWPQFVTLLIVIPVLPSLFEELAFRIVLPRLFSGPDPHPRMQLTADLLALTLFVLWHPVQVWLGLPMAQPVFTHPAFLAIAAGLGATCAWLYRRSGSIWPPVGLHAATVLVWKLSGG